MKRSAAGRAMIEVHQNAVEHGRGGRLEFNDFMGHVCGIDRELNQNLGINERPWEDNQVFPATHQLATILSLVTIELKQYLLTIGFGFWGM